MAPTGLPGPLTEHAEQLLAGTGVDAEQATRLARSTGEPAADLDARAVEALRTGWASPELAADLGTDPEQEHQQ